MNQAVLNFLCQVSAMGWELSQAPGSPGPSVSLRMFLSIIQLLVSHLFFFVLFSHF